MEITVSQLWDITQSRCGVRLSVCGEGQGGGGTCAGGGGGKNDSAHHPLNLATSVQND